MENLAKIYDLAEQTLLFMPDEDSCTEEELEVYRDLAALKVSLGTFFRQKGIDPGKLLPWYEEEWLMEDILDALDSADAPHTERNLEIAVEECRHLFDDKSDRNEMLVAFVSDLKDSGRLES